MTPHTLKRILADLNQKFNGLSCRVCIIEDELGAITIQIEEINNTLEEHTNILEVHETRITILEGTNAATITVVTNYGALPDPTTVPGEFYYAENSQGTQWLPGSFGGTYYPDGLYYSTGTVWETSEMPWNAAQVTVDAGINNTEFLTPLTYTNSAQLAAKADINFAIAMAAAL